MRTSPLQGASAPGTTVRKAEPTDARAIARAHRAALPEAFLSSLGPRFLTAAYRHLIGERSAIVLIAEREGRIVGFVAATRDPTRLLASGRIRLAMRVGHRLLAARVRERIRRTAAFVPPAGLPAAELLAIAVEPEHRRDGVAAGLVRALMDRLRQSGTKEFKVLVAKQNDGANMFYAALGFTLAQTLAGRSGEETNVWIAWKPSV